MDKIEKAISKPESVFAKPGDVLDASLPQKVKRRILESWEYTLTQSQVATEENMQPENAGDERVAESLQGVRSALKLLNDD
jgi:hypothetical protein